MSSAAPFAFEDVPRHEREEALALRALARLGAPSLPEAVAQTCRELLGTALSVSAHGPAARASKAQLESMLATRALVSLELQVAAPPARALVALPHELCTVLVDRVLGGDGNVVQTPGAALDPMSLGVLGYLAARMAATTDGAVRIAGLAAERPAAQLHGLDGVVIAWPARVALEAGAAAIVHVLLSTADAASLLAVASRRTTAARAKELGGCRIELCAHAGVVVLSTAELASLQVGDVVLPELPMLEPAAGGYAGQVELHALGRPRAPLARCSLGVDTLTITRLSSDPSEETHPMTEGHKHDHPGEARQRELEPLADAPLELCLELARFSLRLDELLSLREGELLSTGKPVGSDVTLTAAGRAVARGELIVLDGELGLRITTLLRAEP